MTTIPSSSPSLCSLKLFRLSSRESLIDGAFLGNRTKPSQSLHLQFRMEAVSSISTSLSCISVGEDFPAEYEQWLPVPDPETRRRAGILLHPTSFRGPHGIGDLGEEAFRFILLVAPFGRFFLWFLKTKEDLLMQDRFVFFDFSGHKVHVFTSHHDKSRCFEETLSGELRFNLEYETSLNKYHLCLRKLLDQSPRSSHVREQDRASDKCQREKKKAINGDDLLWAMATLGFEDYIEPLKVYLTRYREISRMLLMARIMVWDNNLDTRHEVPFDSQDED